MEMLQELRTAHYKKEQKKAISAEIQKQFDQINKLKREKALLFYKLQALGEGNSATDLYPSYAQDPEFLDAHRTLASLKRKLSAYRLCGPCGLTVLKVSGTSLVISFTSVWKNLTQSFVLNISDDKGVVKVTGTTIPYFIDVNSMLTSAEVMDWPKVMEDIGFLLNAYTQRRKEVELVESKHKSVIKQLSYNEPVTAVDMKLSLASTISSDAQSLQMDISLVYDGIQAIHPHKISISSSHCIPKEGIVEIRALLTTKSLSETMPLLLEKLKNIPFSDGSGDDERSKDHDDIETDDESS